LKGRRKTIAPFGNFGFWGNFSGAKSLKTSRGLSMHSAWCVFWWKQNCTKLKKRSLKSMDKGTGGCARLLKQVVEKTPENDYLGK